MSAKPNMQLLKSQAWQRPFHSGAMYQAAARAATAHNSRPRIKGARLGGQVTQAVYPARLRPRDSRGKFVAAAAAGAAQPRTRTTAALTEATIATRPVRGRAGDTTTAGGVTAGPGTGEPPTRQARPRPRAPAGAPTPIGSTESRER